MSWPLSHEFNEAVQNPRVVFSDPDLKGGETVVGATGLPLPRSGNFADVYQVRGADGRDWAVKCFTRPVVGLAERYAKLSDTLAKAELPFAVGFTYLAEGIRVGGAWRPILKMEWVEGLLLNQVARENAGKPKVLSALGQMWAKLCKRLREAGIAHADIQHGNVLLVPGSRTGAYGLKLIDYDGMWVPALANTPSGESGHSSYQHPARASTRAYSPDVDRFPHLVVATALRGLTAGGSALWEKYDNGDNLLFTEADYKRPADSALMKELWHAGDPLVQSLVGRLAIACGKPIPQTPWLDHLAPEGEPAVLDDATRREAAAALGISLPVPVALPPEPVVELPPEPEYTAEPEPEPEPIPPAPVFEAVFVAPADDGDRDEERRPAKKSKKPKKRRGAEGAPKKNHLLLFGGAGLLLLVGGVVAGVLIAGGKKSTETAQQKADDPKGPKERHADPVAPRPKVPSAVVSPPKDKPEPAPKAKDPETSGPAPVVPPPMVPAAEPPNPGPRKPDPVILGHPSDPAFKDLAPDGGYLIGLDVGLGKFGASDVIHSLRPIYRTGNVESKGSQRGPDLPRVVPLKARDGYAVGAVIVKAGLGLDGLSVIFMKVKADGALDPKDASESDWAGGKGGNAPVTLGGDGTPIVGIIGRTTGGAAGKTHGFGVLLKGQEAFAPGKAPVIIGGGNTPLFKDLAPEGGLLIGLELGLVKLGTNDHIQAGRPIYRVNGKEQLGLQRGMNLTNVVTLKARDGYAVGGLTCKFGRNLDGCSLTFMRVKPDGTLDPTDSYASEWAGLNIPIGAMKLGGDGTPVVGIAGRASDKQLFGFGLLLKGQEGFETGR